MKLSAAFSVVAVLVGRTLVSAFPLPDAVDSKLEVRGESLDIENDSLWARELDDELEVFARDLMDAFEDILYARASKAVKFAWEGVGKDATISKVGQLAQQAIDSNKPKPGPSPFWQKAVSGAKQQAKKPAARPAIPTVPGPSKQPPKNAKAQQNWSKAFSAAKNKDLIQKANAKSAAQKGANAIIAKQKKTAAAQKGANAIIAKQKQAANAQKAAQKAKRK